MRRFHRDQAQAHVLEASLLRIPWHLILCFQQKIALLHELLIEVKALLYSTGRHSSFIADSNSGSFIVLI